MINSSWQHVRQGMQLLIKGQAWEVEYYADGESTVFAPLLKVRRSGTPKPTTAVVILEPGDPQYRLSAGEKALLSASTAEQWARAVKLVTEELGGEEIRENGS